LLLHKIAMLIWICQIGGGGYILGTGLKSCKTMPNL
jgi:hypothetical protein